MIRAVLDTNVFVSAFLLSGRLNRVAELSIQGSFTWLLSEPILEEYAAVASRPLYHLTHEELGLLLYQVKERADWVHVTSSLEVVKADPADDKFLACALDGRADWVVSGDHHLLSLERFHRVRIGTPSEFLKIFPG